jgi:hypothetical protein
VGQLLTGLGILSFGIFVGGVGLASAGIGIGIPMIPLGIYITYRGWRIFKHEKDKETADEIDLTPLEPFEKTKTGKVGLGIILILVGLGTSALFIGIPILFIGIGLLIHALKDDAKALFNNQINKGQG